MKKSIILTVVALISLVGLVGCASPRTTDTESKSGSHIVVEVRQSLSDGRSVICLINDSYRAGGLSCDWENAK